jgi:hypothetical protein
MIAFCLVVLTVSSIGIPGHVDARRPVPSVKRNALPPIPVAVFAPADVNDALVSRIRAETEAIWASAGVTFEWHRVFSEGQGEPRQLEVTIDDRPRDLADGRQALGWITFTAGRPEKSIHLSRSNVEDMLLRTPGVEDMTIQTHQTLIGRALGRALSHEIGHYLLQSKIHTPHGLMRAIWPSGEFFAVRRSGFDLTATERAAAVQHLRDDWLSDGSQEEDLSTLDGLREQALHGHATRGIEAASGLVTDD